VYDALAAIAPDLHRFAVEFAYGDINSRPGLDSCHRELVILGVLIGSGSTESQLEAHLNTALNIGLSPTEIVEGIIQALPRALHGVSDDPRVVERQAAGRVEHLVDRRPPGAPFVDPMPQPDRRRLPSHRQAQLLKISTR
jgi:hypothetical protein